MEEGIQIQGAQIPRQGKLLEVLGAAAESQSLCSGGRRHQQHQQVTLLGCSSAAAGMASEELKWPVEQWHMGHIPGVRYPGACRDGHSV